MKATNKNRTSTSDCPTYPMRTPMDSIWIPKSALVNGHLIGRGRTRHRRVVPFPLCWTGTRNQVDWWVGGGGLNRGNLGPRRFRLLEDVRLNQIPSQDLMDDLGLRLCSSKWGWINHLRKLMPAPGPRAKTCSIEPHPDRHRTDCMFDGYHRLW